MDQPVHIPVLAGEVLALLSPKAGQVCVDCTAGLGGHAARIAPALEPGGVLVLNDADPANLARAAGIVRSAAGVKIIQVHGNFAEVPHVLRTQRLQAHGLLADLGFASNQMEDASRGFSFSRDGPLDMRMNPCLPVTAADLVNSLTEAELTRMIEQLGEDRNARRIARKLVEERRTAPIQTTGQLARVVRAASPRSGQPIDPATRTFQALRIAVNDELGSLEALLAAVESDVRSWGGSANEGRWLAPGARLVLITFHSLEDRLVKQSFVRLERLGACVLTSTPVTPGAAEERENPRSRSAKARAIRLAGSDS